jgi:apolipoprotein N-acyltransferase
MISIAAGLHPWWPIAWIAVTPLLAAAFIASPLEAVGLAVLAAVVGCISTTGFYLEVAGPIVAFLAPVGRAVELVVAVTLARRAVVQWRHWLSIFVYPALTAGFDMLESSFSGHGSAASFAQSQMNAIAVIQIAALAGTSGVVFTVNLWRRLWRWRGTNVPGGVNFVAATCWRDNCYLGCWHSASFAWPPQGANPEF